MRFSLILFLAAFAGHSVAKPCNDTKKKKAEYIKEAIPRLSKLADKAPTIWPNGPPKPTTSAAPSISSAGAGGNGALASTTTLPSTISNTASASASASASTATSTGSGIDDNDSGLRRRYIPRPPLIELGKKTRQDIEILLKDVETLEKNTETPKQDGEHTNHLSDEEYEDKFYEKVGNQIKHGLEKKNTSDQDAETVQNDTAHGTAEPDNHSYVVTKEVKVLEHHQPDVTKAEEKKGNVDVKALKNAIREGVEQAQEKEKHDEEDQFGGGDEKEQYRRLTELYMQYRPMLAKAIQKDLDPILKGEEEPKAGEELAKQHMKGNEKQQRKRLTELYMDFRHMLVPKIQKQLDPILHE